MNQTENQSIQDWKNKVIIITGGANGIGRCLTEEFCGRGALIAFIDQDEEAGNALQKKLGKNVLFVPGNVARQEVLESFAQAVQTRYGRVDVLINNACFSAKGILSGCSYEEFQSVLQTGVIAPYYLTKCLLPCFQEGGSVVNISSSRAFQSQPDTESYTAAKGGITALTHGMALSLGASAVRPDGVPVIRVNGIAPGWIETAPYRRSFSQEQAESSCNESHGGGRSDLLQHPSGRIGTPMDIFHAVCFLASPANSFINGQTILVDGGMSAQMIYHDDAGWSFQSPRE